MNGRIKMFNEERGFGFILGEDQNDYFFHISNVKSAEPVFGGCFVTFTPGENTRGKVAKDVVLQQGTAGRPTFIGFGDVRIKLGNIKNYGLSEGEHCYAKVYTLYRPELFVDSLADCLFGKTEWIWTGEKVDLGTWDFGKMEFCPVYQRVGEEITKVHDSSYRYGIKTTNDIIREPEEYLYVTTFQGDNYRFFQSSAGFDIHEKLAELDKYLCG